MQLRLLEVEHFYVNCGLGALLSSSMNDHLFAAS